MLPRALCPSPWADSGVTMRTRSNTILSTLTSSCLLLAACNQAPEGLEIALSPTEPHTLDELSVTISADAVDPNDNEVTYKYAWSLDGNRVDDLTSATVPSSLTHKGESWEVTVSPWDGKLTGTTATASVTVLNSAPTATVSIRPDDPVTTDDVKLEVTSADNDRDSVSLRYSWSLNGSVTSLTSDSLRANRTNKGEVWEVSVYADDGETEGEPAVATVTIGNTPPEVVKAIVQSDPSPATSGSVLTCQPIGWSDVDEDDEGYRVQWYVNGVVSLTTMELSGKFVRDDSVHCQLAPFDGDDEGDSVVSDAVIVRNEAPSLDSVTIGPEDPKNGTTVTSTLGDASDADGDGVSYRYSWRIAGREVAVTEELSASRFKRADEIILWVTPTDGYDDGEPVKSNVVTGGNNVPEIISLVLDPATPQTDDAIEAKITSKDLDGDKVGVSVEWYVNSKKVSPTGAMLDGKTWFSHFDEVYAIVRPDDGYDKGAAATSSTITVKNTPPSEPGVVFSPAEPTDGDDIICVIDTASSDDDKDSISYTFAWTVDGKSALGTKTTYANDTLAAELWDVERPVVCTVTPNDSYDDGIDGEARTAGVSVDLDFPSSGSTTKSGKLGSGGGGR
ncbi:MAG: hypothetical protein ACI9MC_003422, partial [Kiritimatiellia bacterium]